LWLWRVRHQFLQSHWLPAPSFHSTTCYQTSNQQNLPCDSRYWWQFRGINIALNYVQILICHFGYSSYIGPLV
jgi:hypothetical protein